MSVPDAAQAAAALVPAPSDGLSIDFANTRYWRGSKAATETLSAPGDLLDWVATAGAIPAARLKRFRAAWAARPDAGASEFGHAIAWREAIFRGLSAAAAGALPEAADLELLNQALSLAPVRQRVGHAKAGLGWEVQFTAPLAATLLAPVLWSAGDLLLGARLAQVRRCANPACLFLFLDDSKTGNRRWCSMSGCGNRAKAHRHYMRRKAAQNAE